MKSEYCEDVEQNEVMEISRLGSCENFVGNIETSNSVGRLIVVSHSPWMSNHS